MPIDNNQNIQQAKLVPGTEIRPGQKPVQLELFDAEGNPTDYPTRSEVQQMIDDALAASP